MKGQVFTIAKFHYINGVVYFVASKPKTDLQTIADNYIQTTKSGNVKHPLTRVRTLARFAEGLGLISISKDGTVEATKLGKRYYKARLKDKWSLSKAQKDIMCNHILSNINRTETIYSIATLHKLYKKGLTGNELASEYAKAIGKDEAWQSDVTYEGFTKFGLDYINELGLAEVVNMPQSTKSRNPKWARDELILALDLYFKVNPVKVSKDHPAIIELSDTLNNLPIHPTTDRETKFRNPNGVYMKLCNYLRFDPDYKGEGLKAGGKLEKVIWEEFATDRDRLAAVAKLIRENYPDIPQPQTTGEETELIDEDEEFLEGRVLTRLHKQRERNPILVRMKKKKVLAETGKLECEVCTFDFAVKYGAIGNGFAECHHKKPVSDLEKGDKTKISDLAIVCANCHRMLHRAKPWLSVDQLKKTKT